MNNINVNPCGVSFGNVVLARGGAEYMASNLTLKNAAQFINKQAKNSTNVVVSNGNVEVVPPRMNMIMNILGFAKRDSKKHYIDVYFDDHGQRGCFRIPRNVSNRELSEYGKNNKKFTLSRIVANEIENNSRWESLVTFQSPAPEVEETVYLEGYRDPVNAKANAEEIKKLCSFA